MDQPENIKGRSMNADLNILSGRAKGIYIDGSFGYDGATLIFDNKLARIRIIKIEFFKIDETKIFGNGMLQETKIIGKDVGKNYSLTDFVLETKLVERTE